MTVTLDLAACRAELGTCPRCGDEDRLLYPTDMHSVAVCPSCVRTLARGGTKRVQACDRCGEANGAVWRNPKHRKNEYLCPPCHLLEGERPLQWFESRLSTPLDIHPKAVCEARNVPGTKDCSGEVKPRGGHLLCNAHSGKPRYA